MTQIREIQVGCAIIEKEGRILIAQRNPGTFLGGYWEFPGGKQKSGETMEQCVLREIKEELGIEIKVREFLRQDDYRYPDKIVHLHFYLCDWVEGVPQRLDCRDFVWIAPQDLRRWKFPVGDDTMINELVAKRSVYFGKNVRNKFWLKNKSTSERVSQ